jgi:V8-like Glu-specific endopeptidase
LKDGFIKGVEARFSKAYKERAPNEKNKCPEEDYALVKLDNRVESKEKCLPLTPICQYC